MTLSVDQTQSLIDLLEDVQLNLATMLTLPHVAPVRDAAHKWASKLSLVSAVLEKVFEKKKPVHCVIVISVRS